MTSCVFASVPPNIQRLGLLLDDQKGPAFTTSADEHIPDFSYLQNSLQFCKEDPYISRTCRTKDVHFTFPVCSDDSSSKLLFRPINPVNSRLVSLLHTRTFLDMLDHCICEQEQELAYALHRFIVGNGLESDPFFASHLIRMFQSLNLSFEADQAFLKIQRPTIFAWTAIIFAYVSYGQNDKVHELYKRMLDSGLEPDGAVLVAVLKSCAVSEDPNQGEQIHARSVEYGLESDAFVSSALIHLYIKCGFLSHAHIAFEKHGKHYLASWNALITGYVHCGFDGHALDLFREMQNGGIPPDRITFLCILKACTNTFAMDLGEQVHFCIVNNGLVSDVSVVHSLIDMYAKCGNIQGALVLFQKLPRQDVIAWSAIIAGYARHSFIHEVLQCFDYMQEDGVQPNEVTFISIINACSTAASLEVGKKIHMHVVLSGYETDLLMGTALVDMYSKCGSLLDAHAIFDHLFERNSITWNSLIGGYVDQGYGQEVLQLFQQMQQQGVVPDRVTFDLVLKACCNVEQCHRVHSLISNDVMVDVSVGNILIDMYARCGSLEDSKFIFDRLKEKNVVTWSTLIAGLVQHECGQEAFNQFEEMQQEGITPNRITFLWILKACSLMSVLNHGKYMQAAIIENGLESDERIISALVDMYSKCGSIQDAKMVFNRLPTRDKVTWSALIGGYAYNNDYEGALTCFDAMQVSGIKPDGVAFLCLLSACSHVGMIPEGCLHFKSMREVHGMFPALEHYDCLVDLFSHAGELDVAEDLLETVPFKCNKIGWKSLLNACRRHDTNASISRRCFNYVINYEPWDASGFRLMCDIYSSAGLQIEAKKLERSRRNADIWKIPAKAFVEINNLVHCFTVGDSSHPSNESIYAKLKSLTMCMEELGYSAQHAGAMSNENASCGHAEKLAIAFGLLNTPHGTTIRVSKNFRVCNRCHTETRLISRLENRTIVIADSYCVHNFTDGLCSCRD